MNVRNRIQLVILIQDVKIEMDHFLVVYKI